MYVIGGEEHPRLMMCLRSKSADLRMFFTTIVVAMASETIKPRVRFSKAI